MEPSFISATVLLIVITDPLGNITPVLAALRGVEPPRRKVIILRECAIAFFVLLLFMFFGQQFLSVLQLKEETLKVAGGVILFLIAINMVFPGSGAKIAGAEGGREPFIVPIAIPLISGPSAMVTVMIISGSNSHRMLEWVFALLITIAVSAVVMLLSTRLQRILGDQVITAFERLMGLVLTAISIDMLLSGVAAYIRILQLGS
ncbi:MAG TPA: MarC family protein [Rectinemataceae bacterium]|nr:MarC family protein [Rectinemataceae bacterium]